MELTEVRVLREITGKTLYEEERKRNHRRAVQLGRHLRVEALKLKRWKEWNNHIDRIEWILLKPNHRCTTLTTTYAAEATKTIQSMELTEVRVLRRITGKTLYDEERKGNHRKNVQLGRHQWVGVKEMKRSNRMCTAKLVRIGRDKFPRGQRSIGRPRVI